MNKQTTVQTTSTGHPASNPIETVFSIVFPYPSSDLSPNARHHWSRAAAAKKRYRGRCRVLAEGVGLGRFKNATERDSVRSVLVSLTFVSPDRRRRDWDNQVASMKSGLDGLADAMGIDDSRWRLAIDVASEPVKGGAVLVEVTITSCEVSQR